MKVSLIGPGSIEKIWKFSKLNKEKTLKLIEDIGKLLAEKAEIIALPSRGAPLEIAKAYKEYGGKKFIGVVPSKDKRYGINHIKEYIGVEDKRINFRDWYNLNGEIAAMGDYCIVFGLSAGTMTEICMLKYHQKLRNSKTKLIIFKNTISSKFQKEILADLKNVYYATDVKGLRKILNS